jgi:hypothetical protein
MTANITFSLGCKELRGIELHIVDAETNESISDICVWYKVTTVKSIQFVEEELKTVVTKKLVTNENGIVFIEPNIIFLELFQSINSELIYINIDVNNGNDPIKIIDDHLTWYFLSSFNKDYKNEKIFFPNMNYYPAMVYSNPPPSEKVGYMIMQVSDSRTNNREERFVQYPRLSNMKEKPYAIMTIELKRSQ